jgi:bidirectional [NiFe] hydrogenase diaphorase subunit
MYIRIDGKQVEAKKWDTVLTAARRAGIDIPSLCYHPALETAAACRMCVVEVFHVGWSSPRTVASCDYKVSEGLEVSTHTEKIQKLRQSTIELLLARAPSSPVLQKMAEDFNLPTRSLPLVSDAGNCILCLLCTRVCEQMGCHAISVAGRGEKRFISTPYDGPSDACIGCGACARICPTNCIEMTETSTTITIWGKEFERVLCDACGAPLISKAYREYAIASRELPDDYYSQCPECKRNETAQKFSGLLLKVHHG